MTDFIKKHEAFIKETMDHLGTLSPEAFRDYHLAQIHFLQHERLVHLLVTIAFAFLFIFSLVMTWVHPVELLYILDLILLILLIFYILHYYRLENTVQRWYLLYNKMMKDANCNYFP